MAKRQRTKWQTTIYKKHSKNRTTRTPIKTCSMFYGHHDNRYGLVVFHRCSRYVPFVIVVIPSSFHLFMTYHRIINKSNTTCASRGEGTAYPFGICVAQSLVFCVVFCRSLSETFLSKQHFRWNLNGISTLYIS